MKTQTLSIRVDNELIKRLGNFESESKVERATLIRASVEAALDHYEATGGITFPLAITDAKHSPKSSKRGEGKS